MRKPFIGSGKLFTRSENSDLEVTDAALRRVAGETTDYRFMIPRLAMAIVAARS